jgi:hypothetical protein
MLPLEMLQTFYKDIAVKHVPSDPSILSDSHLWDKFETTTVCYMDWTVIYRFFSGGNDKFKRPGRYIILTAWIKTEETKDIDLSPIQANEVFRFIEKNGGTLPVPPPKTLTGNWDIEPQRENARGKASFLGIISVALLSFLLGVGTGIIVGTFLTGVKINFGSISFTKVDVQPQGSDQTKAEEKPKLKESAPSPNKEPTPSPNKVTVPSPDKDTETQKKKDTDDTRAGS